MHLGALLLLLQVRMCARKAAAQTKVTSQEQEHLQGRRVQEQQSKVRLRLIPKQASTLAAVTQGMAACTAC